MADWAEDVAEEIVNSPRAECPDLDSGAWVIDREWLEAAVAQGLRAARAEGIEAAAKVAEGVTDYSDSLQRASGCLTAGERAALAIRALLTKESSDAF